jgi:hypothetical protein
MTQRQQTQIDALLNNIETPKKGMFSHAIPSPSCSYSPSLLSFNQNPIYYHHDNDQVVKKVMPQIHSKQEVEISRQLTNLMKIQRELREKEKKSQSVQKIIRKDEKNPNVRRIIFM